MSERSVSKRRRTVAYALVVSLFLALGVSQSIEEGMANEIEQVGLNSAMLADATSDQWGFRASEVSTLLDWAETVLEKYEGAMPNDFAEEIGVLANASSMYVYAYAQGCIVGYSVVGNAQEAQQTLEGLLQSRGWVASSLGGVVGATFVKNEGRYGWALSTCTQIGDKVSVVVRCLVREGGDA